MTGGSWDVSPALSIWVFETGSLSGFPILLDWKEGQWAQSFIYLHTSPGWGLQVCTRFPHHHMVLGIEIRPSKACFPLSSLSSPSTVLLKESGLLNFGEGTKIQVWVYTRWRFCLSSASVSTWLWNWRAGLPRIYSHSVPTGLPLLLCSRPEWNRGNLYILVSLGDNVRFTKGRWGRSQQIPSFPFHLG